MASLWELLFIGSDLLLCGFDGFFIPLLGGFNYAARPRNFEIDSASYQIMFQRLCFRKLFGVRYYLYPAVWVMLASHRNQLFLFTFQTFNPETRAR